MTTKSVTLTTVSYTHLDVYKRQFVLSILNNQIILLMLQPELKFRRDKIRYLMAQQGIDAALIACWAIK